MNWTQRVKRREERIKYKIVYNIHKKHTNQQIWSVLQSCIFHYRHFTTRTRTQCWKRIIEVEAQNVYQSNMKLNHQSAILSLYLCLSLSWSLSLSIYISRSLLYLLEFICLLLLFWFVVDGRSDAIVNVDMKCCFAFSFDAIQ